METINQNWRVKNLDKINEEAQERRGRLMNEIWEYWQENKGETFKQIGKVFNISGSHVGYLLREKNGGPIAKFRKQEAKVINNGYFDWQILQDDLMFKTA